VNNGGCQGTCTNYNMVDDGKTHECGCENSMVLASDGKSCLGTSTGTGNRTGVTGQRLRGRGKVARVIELRQPCYGSGAMLHSQA
jgi:hypothetical protein